MLEQKQYKSRRLLIIFVPLAIFSIASILFEFYEMHLMHHVSTDMYEHPLKVSNTAMHVRLNVSNIRMNMEVLLHTPPRSESAQRLLEDIASLERTIDNDLQIIAVTILGKQGKKLLEGTREVFDAWKRTRQNLMTEYEAHNLANAAAVISENSVYADKFEASVSELYVYAHKKAIGFKNDADRMFGQLKIIVSVVVLVLLSLFSVIAYMTSRTIARYLFKNRQLTSLLETIREINQMVVREKNSEILLRRSREILNSRNLLCDIRIAVQELDAKQRERAIPITSNNKTYGFLVLCSEQRMMDRGMLMLFEELAGDIGYALYYAESEERFKKEEERYRFAIEAVQEGLWDWNLVTNEVFFSERWKAMLGYHNDELENRFESWESRLHPADKAGVFEAVRASHEGKSEYFRAIYRLRHKAGAWVWIEARGSTFFDENGRPVRMIGSHTDITKQKEYELQIVYLKELYGNTIDSVEGLIFVKDTNFVYVTCNLAFARLVGKPKEEIIGKSDYDIFSKDEADFFRRHDIKVMEHRNAQSNLEWLRYPDGHRFYALTTKAPLSNASGELIGLVGNSVDITELKNAEDEVKTSNEKFEKAFNNTPNLIVLTQISTGKIFDVNKTFENITGYTRDELIGKTTFDINLWVQTEDRDRYVANLMKEGSIQGGIFSFNKKENGIFVAEVYASLVSIRNERYILAVANDITQRLETEKTLEESHRQLSALMENLPGMAYRCQNDRRWTFEFVSNGCLELTGYEATTLINSRSISYEELIHPDDRNYVWNHVQECLRHNEGFELDYRIIMADGTVKWVWEKGIGIMEQEHEVMILEGVILDNNARKKAEEALKEQEKLIMAQSRLAAMGEMISMIAHQWRQPLTVIAMNANNMLLDIVLDNFDVNTIEEHSHTIVDQTIYLSKTIDDFRNFFKPDKSLSKVTMKHVIEETLIIVKESLRNHNIKVETTYDSLSEVDAYPRELMQVFVNIINNAKDALILQEKEDMWITIHIYEDATHVITEVCDNAGGIDTEIITKIFDPYFTTKENQNGTGLGLYMSKMIIDKHLDGTIEASNGEAGACFKVKLPKVSSV